MKWFIVTILFTANASVALACNNLVQNFPFECALQDDYQKVVGTLDTDFSVKAEQTVSYRSLRLIDQDEYDKQIEKTGYMPWKIYEPAPVTWQLWEQGAKMVDDMVADASLKALTIDDVERLNKVLINKEMMTFLSKLKGNTPGRIRSGRVILPPGAEFKCKENPMSEDDYNMIKDYELKDFEGEPLLRPHFFKKCKDGRGYGGQIWYMGSGKVRQELQRWLDQFNSYFQKFVDGDPTDKSPIEFIVDSQRWFIAIHPFGDGNGRTSRFIQDMFLKKLGLPYMPTGRISMLSTRDQYLKRSKSEIRKSVKFLEGCLGGFQKRKANSRTVIYGHCIPMYDDVDTGESQGRKQERAAFFKTLK